MVKNKATSMVVFEQDGAEGSAPEEADALEKAALDENALVHLSLPLLAQRFGHPTRHLTKGCTLKRSSPAPR